jgi:hypothetical protein
MARRHPRNEGVIVKPLFTIHEGEFVVGDYITRHLKKYEVFVPSKDSGTDLLVVPKGRRKGRPVRLQVKFSRSFEGAMDYGIPDDQFRARGWYTLNPSKIRKSDADLWVFAIVTFRHQGHYVLVPTRELRRRIPRSAGKTWHLYLTVLSKNRCYNFRDLKRADHALAAAKGMKDRKRDYSSFLEDWNVLKRMAKA